MTKHKIPEDLKALYEQAHSLRRPKIQQLIERIARLEAAVPLAIKLSYDDGWQDCNSGSYSDQPHVTFEKVLETIG